jgi:hypothetical protein
MANLLNPFISFPTASGGPTDTGFVLAGTGASVGAGADAWSTPNNITSDTDSLASATVSVSAEDDTKFLQATSFEFVLPSSCTVTGVEVVTKLDNNGAGLLYWGTAQLLIGGSGDGTNKATGTNPAFPESFTEVTWGGAGDMWGLTTATLNDTNINASGFGFQLKAFEDDNRSCTAYVDWIKIKVYYTT